MQQLQENNTASTKNLIPQTKWEIQLLALHKPLYYQELFNLLSFLSDTPPPTQKTPSFRA
jgi:hypothetical protein